MICAKCGMKNADNTRFCMGCGTPLQQTMSSPVRATNTGMQSMNMGNSNMQSINTGNTAVPPINQVIPDYKPGLDYKPLGMWTYFGYDILFAIPIVGFIVLLVLAFGGGNNVNLRNYARSKFCLLIILLILIVLAVLVGMIIGQSY